MPLQNRVQPDGQILATPARGLFMGNRGILHDAHQRLGAARWKHKAWVTCVLKHKDWHRRVMTPDRYTELFFLDEAVALAAGHRPCAMCRNADYKAYRRAAGLSGSAAEMDARLHSERAIPRTAQQRHHKARIDELPDGAIILDGTAYLLLKNSIHQVNTDGYGAKRERPNGTVTVLTPPTSIKALKNGYRPRLHPSL